MGISSASIEDRQSVLLALCRGVAPHDSRPQALAEDLWHLATPSTGRSFAWTVALGFLYCHGQARCVYQVSLCVAWSHVGSGAHFLMLRLTRSVSSYERYGWFMVDSTKTYRQAGGPCKFRVVRCEPLSIIYFSKALGSLIIRSVARSVLHG